MRRPSAGDDSFHCTFMACISVGLCTCIEGIFLKLTWVEAIHILRQNLTVYSSFLNIELHNFKIESNSEINSYCSQSIKEVCERRSHARVHHEHSMHAIRRTLTPRSWQCITLGIQAKGPRGYRLIPKHLPSEGKLSVYIVLSCSGMQFSFWRGEQTRNYCAQRNSLLLSILRGLYSGRWFEDHF